MGDNEGLRKTGEAIVMSIVPDVCLTPPSMLPVPYQIIGRFSDAVRYADTVKMTGLNTVNMDSRLPTVYGDELGVGGGIMSGVNKGWCRPITHSSTVRARGHHITFHTSFYWMNCNGPDGPPNTIGIVTYVENVNEVFIGPLGAILGNTSPTITPETPEEKEWYEKLWDGAAPILSDVWDGAKSAGAYGLDVLHVSGAGWTAAGTDVLKWAGADVDYPDWVFSESTRAAAKRVEDGFNNTVDGLKTLGGVAADVAQVSAAGWTMAGTDAVNAVTGSDYAYPEWTTSASTEDAYKRSSEFGNAVVTSFKKGYEDAYAEGGAWQAIGRGLGQTGTIIGEVLLGKGLGQLKRLKQATDIVDDVNDFRKTLDKVDDVNDARKTLDKVDDVNDARKTLDKVDDVVDADDLKKLDDGVRVSKADYWKRDKFERGRLIEDDLTSSEYAEWTRTDHLPGYQNAKNHPVVDFAKEGEVVSLKTTDTNGSSWPDNLKSDIRELAKYDVPDNLGGNTVSKTIDIRVQPGGTEVGGQKLQDLIKYGDKYGVKVVIKEYP